MNLTGEFELLFLENYRCAINYQEITADIINITGTHKKNKSNEDVSEVEFWDCEMTRVPQGLTKIFPNMKTLRIIHSNLRNIKKDDIAEYKLLEKLNFESNHIEFLPGNLFDDFKNLKAISFDENHLIIIEPTIFDKLNNLMYVDLRRNISYSNIFCPKSFDADYANIKSLKDKLKQVFCENIQCYKKFIQEELEADKKQTFLTDIRSILQDDSHKDFKVLIGDREFPVHKLILAARSSTLAEVLKNNREVENLSLQDIPVDTFEIILNYMYNAEFPKINEYDQLSLYAASGRLKIEELKNFVATHILDQITDENAIEILKLSNKYEHYELKQKSFDIIKKKYSKLKFKDEWIEVPETVCIIIDKFEEKEEIIRKAEEDFENQRESM